MDQNKFYSLPQLAYGYKDLEPYIFEQQLTIHHQKHHQAYVNGANAIFERLKAARQDGIDLDMKSTLKELSFNIGGHLLHSLFWDNMAPAGKTAASAEATASQGGGEPKGKLVDVLNDEFGGFERFKKEFTQNAISVEGSGWATLALDPNTGRPVLMQIEKHNVNIMPAFKILLVLDVFEHAYYLDYKNERAKFIEAFWNIVNWDEVEKRLG